jgi:hypothetical protein
MGGLPVPERQPPAALVEPPRPPLLTAPAVDTLSRGASGVPTEHPRGRLIRHTVGGPAQRQTRNRSASIPLAGERAGPDRAPLRRPKGLESGVGYSTVRRLRLMKSR